MAFAALLGMRLVVPGALSLEKYTQIVGADANRVADAKVREFAAFAEAVDDRGADAEEMGDLAHVEQPGSRTLGGKML
jgi:hypothetical protein